MEEKERYKLCVDVDEEERVLCHYIYDNEADTCYEENALDKIVKLLNEQDKYIEELETQNKRVLEKLELITKSNQELEQENQFLKEKNKSLIDEEEHISKKMQEVGFDNIEDLCKSQKEMQDYTENIANLIDKLTEDNVSARTDLAISELEKLKKYWDWYKNTEYKTGAVMDFFIDNQIKELKGE